MTSARTLVGVLGGAQAAAVDDCGIVSPERAGWRLNWWIGAEDRWHVPSREAAVRQTRVGNMPVLRTAMRIPGGDAVQYVYGAPDLAVVEIRNESPAPFVVALVVEDAARVGLADRVVGVDGRAAIMTARGPSRWSVESDGSTERVVTSGQASEGTFAPRADRAARLTAAFLYPVAHRTTFRAALGLLPSGLGDAELDLGSLPDPDATARGWAAQLDRGMQVALPDPALQDAVEAARADILLAGQAWMPEPEVVAALEDWGFDAEVATAWPRLPGRARRRLGRRLPAEPDWAAVEHDAVRGGAPLLLSLRTALVHESGTDIRVAPTWPKSWQGSAVDVRRAPTRLGPVSFSVRWHGERPALLWEAPPGARLTAPGLDPTWSTEAGTGEALLAASEITR